MLLRALRFLDTIVQRDALQKAAFLKDLGQIWRRMDARVLKFRLLPPLLREARSAHANLCLLCCPCIPRSRAASQAECRYEGIFKVLKLIQMSTSRACLYAHRTEALQPLLLPLLLVMLEQQTDEVSGALAALPCCPPAIPVTLFPAAHDWSCSVARPNTVQVARGGLPLLIMVQNPEAAATAGMEPPLKT